MLRPLTPFTTCHGVSTLQNGWWGGTQAQQDLLWAASLHAGEGLQLWGHTSGRSTASARKNGLGRCPWWVGGQVGWFHGGLGPCALSAGTGNSAAASLPDEGEGAGAAAPDGTAPSKACSLRRPSRPELGHLGSRCEALLLGVACTGNFCAWTCPR